MKFSIIAAVHNDTMGIGRNDKLAWFIPEDMKYFSEMTSNTVYEHLQNAVIMGRVTWESIPERHRPLRNRLNIVISSTLSQDDLPDGVIIVTSFDAAWDYCLDHQEIIEKVFVIGGESVYNEAILHKDCDLLYLTKVYDLTIENNTEFHKFFPHYKYLFDMMTKSDTKRTNEYSYCFQTWRRQSNIQRFLHNTWSEADYEYFRLIEHVFTNGVYRDDRTGTGTLSTFGYQMRFNLQDNVIPLLSTKRVYWNGVLSELLWFLRGQTDAQILIDQKVNIWKGNGSREFLDSVGLVNNREYDLGKVYGFQWRHYGAEYQTCDTDYTGQGVDQIQQIIDTIKNNPTSRRIILNAWNPSDMKELALPPCHVMCQFYVHTETKELSCHMYQRSGDVGLGIPFNIASYSLLTHIIAKLCGLTAKSFIHSLGDVHIYKNHINALQEQLRRTVPIHSHPKIELHAEHWNTVDDIKKEDIVLTDYNPLCALSMKMAV